MFTTARSAVPPAIFLLYFAAGILQMGCTTDAPPPTPIPRTMAQVPASKLAFRFDPDVPAPPDPLIDDDPSKKSEQVQKDFDTRRKDDALVRTVLSPDEKRVLALYATGDSNTGEFRIDLYTSEGAFLRNITPPDLAGAFPQTASWSPDGTGLIFAGRKSVTPKPSPTPNDVVPAPGPGIEPTVSATVAPVFAAIPVFETEQIYIADQDGFNLRPLTTREGLIFFNFEWAPDGKSIAALACKEAEWDEHEKHNLTPAGRPRLIRLDSTERLLDDELSSVLPVWSPDGTKVATAFGTSVRIYDAGGQGTTQAAVDLTDKLMEASASFDKKLETSDKSAPPKDSGSTTPVSFNPIVKLDWTTDQEIHLKTAYVRIYRTEPVVTFQRWHLLNLSPQAEVLTPRKAG